MIKTLSPYSNTGKTAEIMSRYRPIAPKPEIPANSMSDGSSDLSHKINQSPYLRNLWPQLQARPTRTRKRGRASIAPPNLKRQKPSILGFCPPPPSVSPGNNLSVQRFGPGLPQLRLSTLGLVDVTTSPSLVTLPLLSCSSTVPIIANQDTASELEKMKTGGEVIDLNTAAENLKEKDLLRQLQGTQVGNVIAPQPVRPVGSSINVGYISEEPSLNPTLAIQIPKKPEEVEEEVESEVMPAVISDSNNKIRMANSAYKEMVGQPECSWLDSMVACDGRVGGSTSKRINGEVVLRLGDSRVPITSNGFSGWVKIDWERDGKKSSINTFCDVMRLYCESRDYLFTWRFHTRAAEGSQSSCNI